MRSRLTYAVVVCMLGRLALFLLLAPVQSGCCCGGDGYLTLGIGLTGPAGITTPLWDETMDIGPSPVFTASFAEDAPPSGDVFELYRGQERLPLLVTFIDWADNPDTTGSCPHDEQTYETESALEPGDYTLVHRKSRGNGEQINCMGRCPWAPFEGEEALILELRSITSPTPQGDGGADGSPDADL